jgi:uncharacterized protein (DUF1499 family)
MVRRVVELMFLFVVLAVAGTMGAARVWPKPGEGFWWKAGALAGMRQDFGALDILQITRRPTASDALVCPERACQKAQPDIVAPIFPVMASELRRKIALVALSEPRTEELSCGADCATAGRFVQYSALFQFPDTVDVKVFDAGASSSTIAIYSRSVLAGADQGVNRARVERWLAALHRTIPNS